ncbi:RNA recognition motif 2 domain-containing protein [Sarocladium implicatum]|nr:RNA recognition motif 2 domain-containing protein [Sarocladium implicatum]
MVHFTNALSSKLGLSRILWVSLDKTSSVSEIEHCLSMMEVSSGGHLYGTKRLTSRGPGVEIAFTDLRDSIRVKENLNSAHTNLSVDFMSSRHDINETTGSKAESAERGQVLITATWPSTLGPHEKYVTEVITSFLEKYGRLFALVKRTFSSDGAFQAVAEFCNVEAAGCATRTCRDGIAFMGLNVIVEPWTHEAQSEPQGASLFPKMSTPTVDLNGEVSPRMIEAKGSHQTSKTHRSPAFAMYPFMFSPQFPAGTPFMMDTYSSTVQSVPMGPFAPMTPLSPGVSMMRSMYHSPPSPAMTSQYSSSPSKASSAYARPDVRRQGATRATRSVHGTSNHHNHVDTARIREGIDVRTTIMLRNIPNKVDQAMLKRLVDESSWGKYDFMYLRIDFANDCNVGYAFINFVDPLDIVDFVEARGNQRWNCFKSDKVAEISYATIQGKDCLVQKFRNSSVMLEAPHYRPKLYFTSNGPMPELAGQEELFPEPDNQSKMKRSCENAEHVSSLPMRDNTFVMNRGADARNTIAARDLPHSKSMIMTLQSTIFVVQIEKNLDEAVNTRRSLEPPSIAACELLLISYLAILGVW